MPVVLFYKRFVGTALILLLFLPGGALAQEDSTDEELSAEREALQRIETAMVEGDARMLLTPAAERVELTIFDMRSFYSRTQALYVIQDFFGSYAPQQFSFEDISCREDRCSATGAYAHARSEEDMLRVYVRLGLREAEWTLQEIRIERNTRP